MKLELFLVYLKLNNKSLVISFLFSMLFTYLLGDKGYYIFCGYFLLSIFKSYREYNERLIKLEKLKLKGLTEEDIPTIEFVKKWGETRQLGLLKYCIINGGLITGALLSLPLSLLVIYSKGSGIFDELSGMFKVIGLSYLAGGIIAIIIYRVGWVWKEDQFKTATDPFYKTLSSKTGY